jgi:hypothetical protein
VTGRNGWRRGLGFDSSSRKRDRFASEFQIPSGSAQFGDIVRRSGHIQVMQEGSDQSPKESLEIVGEHGQIVSLVPNGTLAGAQMKHE